MHAAEGSAASAGSAAAATDDLQSLRASRHARRSHGGAPPLRQVYSASAPSAAVVIPPGPSSARIRTTTRSPLRESALTAPLPSYLPPAPSTAVTTPSTLPSARMMLSTLSHSMPPSTYRPRDPLAMTASLPLIAHPAALPQRPKLSLDTQQVRTFGKGSTSLRLDTLSAVSPTVRNTFSNAYEQRPADAALPASPAPRSSRPRLCIDSSCSPLSASTPSSASTLSSGLTSASTDSATVVIPYKQPHNLASILSNSPARSLAPRKMAARPLFPAEKRVSFRTPLEEEITTVKYTVAHSDLASSTSTISSLATTESETSELSLSIESASVDAPSPPAAQSPSEPSDSAFSSMEGSPQPRGPRIGDKRDSSESDSDSCPETPVAGRRKRRRNWVWTLGPLPSDQSTSTSASDATSDDDS